jgi:hypothetical protein
MLLAKMASSSEAFAKFSKWKNSSTSLKVMKGEKSKILYGRIWASDPTVSIVGFFETASDLLTELGFVGATFRVGRRSVEVECGEDLFVFEDISQ